MKICYWSFKILGYYSFCGCISPGSLVSHCWRINTELYLSKFSWKPCIQPNHPTPMSSSTAWYVSFVCCWQWLAYLSGQHIKNNNKDLFVLLNILGIEMPFFIPMTHAFSFVLCAGHPGSTERTSDLSLRREVEVCRRGAWIRTGCDKGTQLKMFLLLLLFVI